jgi:menaquinone-9 beta-reductase
MSMADADVIVVGAGPAGAVCAMLLARAGHHVLLLDRAAFPRPKPCGDCLSAGATAVLAEIGLLSGVRELPHGRITEWRIHGPGGALFTGRIANPPGHAMSIERAVLDNHLVAAATAAGARLQQEVRVDDVLRGASGAVTGVLTSDGPRRARLVVGADGLRSVVASRLGAVRRPPRLRKVSFTLHIDAPLVDGHVGEMHGLGDACIGAAPVRADGLRCNLTLVATTRRYQRDTARQARSQDPFSAADPRRSFLRALLEATPHLLERLPEGALKQSPLTSGPFDRPVRRVTFDGAALAGDAAGYYDPFTGQGVTHALRSAVLLARAADGALRSDDCSAAALQPYARALAAVLRAPRLLQRTVEAVLSRPTVADAAIGRLARAPVAADALISVIGMTAPHDALFSTAVIHDVLRRRPDDHPR